jgi:hypothetical protein
MLEGIKSTRKVLLCNGQYRTLGDTTDESLFDVGVFIDQTMMGSSLPPWPLELDENGEVATTKGNTGVSAWRAA